MLSCAVKSWELCDARRNKNRFDGRSDRRCSHRQHGGSQRRLDMVRRRMAMTTAMAGELGTAARGAIRCKAASVSPIEVPSAADGAPGTVVRPAIRSRVASASRIAALLGHLSRLPTRRHPESLKSKRLLLKELCKTRAEILPQKGSRCGSDFHGCLQLGWRAALRGLKIRGIAPHRAG